MQIIVTTKRKIRKEDLVVRLKLNRIIAQRGMDIYFFFFACIIHVAAKNNLIAATEWM